MLQGIDPGRGSEAGMFVGRLVAMEVALGVAASVCRTLLGIMRVMEEAF